MGVGMACPGLCSRNIDPGIKHIHAIVRNQRAAPISWRPLDPSERYLGRRPEWSGGSAALIDGISCCVVPGAIRD